MSTSSQLQATTTAKQCNSKAAKKTSKKLNLPRYETVEEIKYGTFVRELQETNPNENLRSKDIKNALRRIFIEVIGKDGFRRMKRSSAQGPSDNHWKALMEEKRELWADKQSKKQQGAKT